MTGKRIVNTRATHQNSRFTALLQAQGAEVIEYPCIAIAPPEDDTPLRRALASLDAFDWLVLTSANTVLALSTLLPQPLLPILGGRGERGASPPSDSPSPNPASQCWNPEGTRGVGGRRVAAVGPTTAKAAQEYLGLEAVLLPETFTAEVLGEALPIKPGQRVLIPASAIASPTLAELLTARGAEVTVVEAYRTVIGTGGADIAALLAQKRVNAVTFTSASTVENFITRLESEGGNRADLAGVCLACIGPQTAAMAQTHGLAVDVMPATHTLDGLIEALQNYYG
ncbi:MAG: uroporphyrinogen-III synthase [Armatimonadetes bacterium]|nr:uroporphyrinogen-III synthase [Armatimonadota bacterium]